MKSTIKGQKTHQHQTRVFLLAQEVRTTPRLEKQPMPTTRKYGTVISEEEAEVVVK